MANCSVAPDESGGRSPMRRGRTAATGGAAFASCRTGGVSSARSPLSTRGGSTTLETGIRTLRIRRRLPHGISLASRTSSGDRRTRCRAFSYVLWVGTNHLTASGSPCTEDPVRASVRIEQSAEPAPRRAHSKRVSYPVPIGQEAERTLFINGGKHGARS